MVLIFSTPYLSAISSKIEKTSFRIFTVSTGESSSVMLA